MVSLRREAVLERLSGEGEVDIAAWLRGLGLERYEPVFRDNEIDAAVLPRLTADDLKDMGVTVVGHRRKLLDAIAALRAGGEAPPSRSVDAGPAPSTTVAFFASGVSVVRRLGGRVARATRR
jgi:hypothetical protein